MSKFWHKKYVLLTGGAGFIGSRVRVMLQAYGATVITVDPRAPLHSAESVNCKAEDIPLLGNLIDESDYVIHMAATVAGIQVNSRSHAEMFKKNLIPTFSVLDACANAGKKVLLVSSACVYPESVTYNMDETHGHYDLPEASNQGYGWAKRMGEKYAEWLAAERGLRYAVVRPFNAYGPGDNFNPSTSHVIPGLIQRIHDAKKTLEIWGTGNQERSFIYADDFAEGVVLAAEKLADGEVVNLGSDESVSILALANLICEIMDKDLSFRFDATKPDGHHTRVAVTGQAKEKIGFTAKTKLKDGLKRTVRYFNEKVAPKVAVA